MPAAVRLNVKNLRALDRRMGSAAARAINKSVVSARVIGARAISKDMGLKVGTVREQLIPTRATTARPEAELRVRGSRIPLIEFGARGPEPSRGRGRGVTYRIGGRRRRRLASAFITTVRGRTGIQAGGGHRGVFRRLGTSDKKSRGAWSKNLPIIELFGPSIVRVFSRRSIQAAIKARYGEAMITNLKHEVAFELQRLRV
jgi:hypothetical protein